MKSEEQIRAEIERLKKDRHYWQEARDNAKNNGYDFDYADHLIGVFTYGVNLLNWVLRNSEEEGSEV